MMLATVKATVVKKPNTFWRRTSVECMLDMWEERGALFVTVCGLWEEKRRACSRRRDVALRGPNTYLDCRAEVGAKPYQTRVHAPR
jgi:hypothetical protein